jgi:hypothetical protein
MELFELWRKLFLRATSLARAQNAKLGAVYELAQGVMRIRCVGGVFVLIFNGARVEGCWPSIRYWWGWFIID